MTTALKLHRDPMRPLRWIRKLRLQSLEAFSVQEASGEAPLCWVIILDHERRAKPDERPAPLPDEHEDEPNNYVEVLVLHSRPIDEAVYEEITRTLRDLLPETRGRFWTVSREQVEAQKMDALEGSYRSMLDALTLIDNRRGFAQYERRLDETTEDRLIYLSQDPKPFRYRRELKLRDIEVFRVTRSYMGSAFAFLILLDYRRPATPNDFPYLKRIADENDCRDNFCRMVVVHKWPEGQVPEEMYDTLAMGFLEQMHDCNWAGVFERISEEELESIDGDRTALMSYLERTLKRYGVEANLASISEKRFSHLSQD